MGIFNDLFARVWADPTQYHDPFLKWKAIVNGCKFMRMYDTCNAL